MLCIHQNPGTGLAKTVGFIFLPKDKPIGAKRSFRPITDLFPADPRLMERVMVTRARRWLSEKGKT